MVPEGILSRSPSLSLSALVISLETDILSFVQILEDELGGVEGGP